MPAIRAEAAAQLRRTLQDHPILAAFAFDRARKTRARAFTHGLLEGMRARLGEGTFALDRWPADQPRAHGWEQQFTRRLADASVVLVVGSSSGWAERALELSQRERRHRPTLPLLLVLPERATPPSLDPAPTAVISVRAFDRLAAARLEAPLVEAIRRTVTLTPVNSERAPNDVIERGAPILIRCPCGVRHDLRPAFYALPAHTLLDAEPFDLRLACHGHETVVALHGKRVMAVRRSDAREPTAAEPASADPTPAAPPFTLDARAPLDAATSMMPGTAHRLPSNLPSNLPSSDVTPLPARLRFYDELLQAIQTTISPKAVRDLLAGVVARDDIERDRAALLALLRGARIYLVAPDATDCVQRTVARLRAIPAIAPPVPHLYLEFEDPVLQLDSGEVVRALTLWPLPASRAASWPHPRHQYEILLWLDTGHFVRCAVTSASEWIWSFGPCQDVPCPLADVRGEWMRSSHALPNLAACHCARVTQGIMTYIATLLTLLRADGVEQVTYTAPSGASVHAGHSAQALQQARNGATLPRANVALSATGGQETGAVRWVRISLSERRHLLRDPLNGGDLTEEDEDGEDATGSRPERATRLAQVATHPRLLIPGPNKPWRGDTPRVVWVRAHERRVVGDGVTRYHVEG
jgi:hypothetical protein